MFDSFIIVLREGFEAFLIVAITLAYLRKTGRKWLSHAVYWAIAASIAASIALAYVLKNGVNESFLEKVLGEDISYNVAYFFNNQSLSEGALGVVAIVLVTSLVIHMWRTGGQLKKNMEGRLNEVSSRKSRVLAVSGVFLFTLLMITREGMETALLLLQVHDPRIVSGIVLGIGVAAAVGWLWARFSHLINLTRFFQVTGIYLLLFMVQVAIYSFHELTEAGLFPNSDALHEATEPFSPSGLYGKWFSLLMIALCAICLLVPWCIDRIGKDLKPRSHELS